MTTVPAPSGTAVRHGEPVAVHRRPWWSLLLAILAALPALTWGLPPAGATHAHSCDTTGDPTLDRAACLPHQAWDAVSGGHPEGALCALQDTLGVRNVKDCHASP